MMCEGSSLDAAELSASPLVRQVGTRLAKAAMEASIPHLDRPVFIVGAPRSGTTWLQLMLLAHPAICGGQESHFFWYFDESLRLYGEHLQSERRVGFPCYWEQNEFKELIRTIWRATFIGIAEDKPGATVLLEKTPRHALRLDRIVEIFPQARFIHLIRDSRSVVASLLAARRDGWGESWAPPTARAATFLWSRYVEHAGRAGARLGASQYIEARFESLKINPVAELIRLLEFVQVDSSSEQVAAMVGSTQAGEGAPSSARFSKEPEGFRRKGSVDGWRSDLTTVQQWIVWRYSWRQMRKLGYTYRGLPDSAQDSAQLNGRLHE